MKKAVLLILLLFLFFMALQNWEGLQKNATDDETIEQAIARLIAVHEADAQSHLGAGESMDNHKSAEVIDHPTVSIVADKISASDVIYSFFFESKDKYPTSLLLDITYAGTGVLTVGYPTGTNAYIAFPVYLPVNFYNENYDMVFSFSSRLENADSNLDGYFQFVNLRFVVVAGELFARFYNNASYSETDLSDVVLTSAHFYKIVFLSTDQTAYFYIDGVLVASLQRPSGTPQISGNAPRFDFTLSGGSYCNVYLASVLLSRSV